LLKGEEEELLKRPKERLRSLLPFVLRLMKNSCIRE